MNDFESYKQLEKENLIPTYARFDLFFDHGKGSTLYDLEGVPYLDLTSGIGVNALGYANEELLKVQKDQLDMLTHVSNLFYTAPMIETAKHLTETSGMDRVFFSNSGAEANEGAIKMARKYARDHYGDHRNKILSLENSFHGRTIATLEATGQEKFHQHFFPYTGGFDYVKANDIKDLNDKIDDSVAAIILEPIQGEGGIYPLEPEFVAEVQRLADENDIVIIVDEVQTGIGRSGKLFAYEYTGLRPDLVTMAKGLGSGLPIGAFMASKKLDGTLNPGDHGSTFGGNVLSSATAKKVLEIIDTPEFLGAVSDKGKRFRNGLEAIDSDDILDVRGQGLMIGIQVPQEKLSDYIKKLMDEHLLVLSAGKDVIRLLPPLVITEDEIDQALGIFKKVFENETSVETA